MKFPSLICGSMLVCLLQGEVLFAQLNLMDNYNPDFESGYNSWSGNGVIDTVNPGQGTHSIRLPADPGNVWNTIKMDQSSMIPVQDGKLYHLSVLGRQTLIGGNLQFGIRQMDGSKNSIQYDWGLVSNSTMWQRQDLTISPTAATEYLQVFLWADDTAQSGAAWMDDVRVEMWDNPFVDDSDSFMEVAPLNSLVYTLNGSTLTPGSINCAIKAGSSLAGGIISWKLLREADPNGAAIVSDAYAVPNEGLWSWTVNLNQTSSLTVGRYLLITTGTGPDGADTQTIVKPIAVVNQVTLPPPVVASSSIDGNGRLLVNGVPFQSIMYYHTDLNNLSVARSLGATTAQVWGTDINTLLGNIDRAWNAGLYSWVALNQSMFVSGSGASTAFNFSNILAVINALPSHPGVIGWYLYDEPDGRGIPASTMIAAYQALKLADPSRVVLVNLCFEYEFSNYAASSDIASFDHYPFFEEELAIMNLYQASIKAANPQKPLISVLQAFNVKNHGFPTFAALRANLYTGICDGMVHAHYYSAYDPPSLYYSFYNQSELNSYSKLLNIELHQLKDFLTSLSPVLEVTLNQSEDIRYLAKVSPSDPSKIILILVNQKSSTIEISGAVNGRTLSSSAAFFPGTRAGRIVAGNLVDTLPPYGVGVYLLQ